MKQQLRLLFYFAVLSFLLLLLVSPDSYLYGVEGHADSGVFYIYGKAMMNGMIPYIDFNEGKGPLLFFIYGMGYLLSKTSYIGVFWISCVFYTFIFYYTYKTAEVFLKNNKKSLVVSILMAVAYFNPLLHYEIRCEDFSQLFIISSLYAICRLLFNDDKRFILKAGFIQGIGIGATLLLKFNITAMLFIFILFGVIYSYRCKYLLRYLIVVAGGTLVVLFPFWVYFYTNNAWPQCVSDFILITEYTVRGTGGDPNITYYDRIIQNIVHPVHLIILLTTLVGPILFLRKKISYRCFPIISFLYFYILTIQNGTWHYYYSTCAVFYLFLFIFLPDTILTKRKRALFACAISLLICIYANMLRAYNYNSFFFQFSEKREAYYKYSYIMNQVHNPKYIKYSLTNLDVLCGALPGYIYMAPIPGEPQYISETRINFLKDKNTDFVLVNRKSQLCDSLINWGFNKYDCGSSELIYSPLKLTLPPDNFHISSWDVLFKRDLSEI